MSQVKIKLYKYCKIYVENRLEVCQQRIDRIQDDLKSETKSSAGDKHETGRAMLQLEREKLGQQLAIIEKDMDFLNSELFKQNRNRIGVGSVVYTNKLNYYIAISAGKVTIEGTTFYAISIESPIGQVLKDKKEDDIVEFRGQKFTIDHIL